MHKYLMQTVLVKQILFDTKTKILVTILAVYNSARGMDYFLIRWTAGLLNCFEINDMSMNMIAESNRFKPCFTQDRMHSQSALL